MKKNNSIYIAIAAGVAVAGLVGFLLATESGRKIVTRFKSKGDRISEEIGDMFEETKEKLDTWKQQMQKECADADKDLA